MEVFLDIRQEQGLDFVAKQWIDYASEPLSTVFVERAIANFYGFLGKKTPRVLYADSPDDTPLTYAEGVGRGG